MQNKNSLTVDIYLFCHSENPAMAKKWQALEKKSNNSVFLSWDWIESWLNLVKDRLFVVECYQGSKTVGLAFFVEKTRKVFGLFPIKQWHLHRTGHQQQDQIWIEYNDFLLAKDIEDNARLSMIEALSKFDHSLKEIVIGLSSEKVLNCFKFNSFISDKLIQSSGYEVVLSDIKKSYLQDVLSKNTRSQINRSNKLLSQLGNLEFNIFTEKNEINLLYKAIAKVHIERWSNTKEGSGFSNETFIAFHNQLVGNANVVEVAVLSLNNKAIGYLVNFIYKKKVYFYLSALTKFDNNKIKVGLTLHEKAIDYYAKQGMTSYDFLGGEARYKQSLSNKCYELLMVRFYKNSWLLIIENYLKEIKAILKFKLSKHQD